MSLKPVGDNLNYSFSERLQQVLVLARKEAASLGHGEVQPAHVLLGILALSEGGAWTILTSLEVDLDRLRRGIIEVLPEGDTAIDPDTPFPFSPESKKALHYALAEAREIESTYVGTEHLLTGLLRQYDELAAEVLRATDGYESREALLHMASSELLRMGMAEELGRDVGGTGP